MPHHFLALLNIDRSIWELGNKIPIFRAWWQ